MIVHIVQQKLNVFIRTRLVRPALRIFVQHDLKSFVDDRIDLGQLAGKRTFDEIAQSASDELLPFFIGLRRKIVIFHDDIERVDQISE